MTVVLWSHINAKERPMFSLVRNLTAGLMAVVVTLASFNSAFAVQIPMLVAADGEVAAGRKTVTVFANNEASASALAAKRNPGWNVVKVKKVNKDPKSRAYQVTLTK
jgi:pyruvate/2-oxoacid:ferredoxin oxidoreductase alpha subunit